MSAVTLNVKIATVSLSCMVLLSVASMREFLCSLDGEACCLDRDWSAGVAGLGSSYRQLVAAGLDGANSLCVHLRELARIEFEDDVFDLSRREVEALKAFQLEVRREAAVAVVRRDEVKFHNLVSGHRAGVAYVGFRSQRVAGMKSVGR